jgi:hypothetical protein
MRIKRNYFLAIVVVAIILLALTGYLLYQNYIEKQAVFPALTTFTTRSSFSLAIGTVSQLPRGANYSVGSEFPDASRMIRVRVIDSTGYSTSSMNWDSPLNANQILALINQTRPQVLERMTAGVFNWTAQVPVCPGCSAMTYGQFLNASMAVCGCYIIPRLGIATQSVPSFLMQAQFLLTVPVFPRLQILSIDNWGSFCSQNGCNCALDQSIFQPLYQMGWKGIGVLNAGPPYYGTCGWATFVDFDVTQSNWSVNQNLWLSIKSDPTVQKILYYDPDFPGQAQALLATCNPSCDQIASVMEQAAADQLAYGITYVYPMVQNFWDATALHLSNGTSVYAIQQNLLNTYNKIPPSQTLAI